LLVAELSPLVAELSSLIADLSLSSRCSSPSSRCSSPSSRRSSLSSRRSSPSSRHSSPSSHRSSLNSRRALAARHRALAAPRRALATRTAPPAVLGDWSSKHSLSQTTEHVILLDHARRLIDHISRRARGLPPRPSDQCSGTASSTTKPVFFLDHSSNAWGLRLRPPD
jgi:hypothetical protein